MEISDKIQEIVDRRKGLGKYEGKGLLTAIEECSSHLKKIKQNVEDFSDFRDKILQGKEGEYASFFQNDPNLETRINAASPETVKKHLETCLAECSRLQERFGRDTINISVIGRARQGKSTLLQAISGLEDSVIPAAGGSHCTGTTSVICNEPGTDTAHAEVVFYTEDEIVKQVKDYIEAIGLSANVTTFGGIPRLQSIIDEYVRDKCAGMDGSKLSWFTHLQKYVEHYSEYSEYVSRGTIPAREGDIRSWVAQKDANGVLTYKYLAVKEVRIYKEFHFAEAGRIVLVDTIGLGDTALGIEKKMLNTLQNNSDAAVVVRMPAPKGGGDYWGKGDVELYDLIHKSIGEKMMDNWLFFVLNERNPEGNKENFNAVRDGMSSRNLHFADLFVVDCCNKEVVKNDLLTPILEHLSKNLADVDKELIADVNKELCTCRQAYNLLYESVNAIISNSPANYQNVQTFGLYKWDTMQGELDKSLVAVYGGYRETRNEACPLVEDEANKKIEELYNFIAAEDWYKDQMYRGINPSKAYSDGLDILRSGISASFEDLNTNTLQPLQEVLKIQVVELLHEGALWKNIPLQSSTTEYATIEWLECFAEEKLKRKFPRLYDAVCFILSYEISIADLLDYKVESSLSVLDTEPGAPDFKPLDYETAKRFGYLEDKESTAHFIWDSTINLLPEVTEKLKGAFSSYNLIPSHSLYARIRKFKEKFFSQEAKKQLRDFYIIYSTIIWASEYKNAYHIAEIFGKLNDLTEMLPSPVVVGNKLVIKESN